MNRTFHLFSATMILALILTLAGLPTSRARADSTITVNSTGDMVATDYQCTLREAINNSNNDTDTTDGDCAAGSGDDTIVFDNSLGIATITLGSALPGISDSDGLTIDGDNRISISGDNLYKILSVSSTVSSFTLQNIRFINGHTAGQGGGLNSMANTLDIYHSTFDHNYAATGGGGLYIYNGTATITDSIFSNNSSDSSGIGGGLENDGTLISTSSTFSDNVAGGAGGGIYTSGTATINKNTFTDNQANNGGGIANGGTLSVTNSSFSTNTAHSGAGLENNSATATIVNSTFTGNTSTGWGGALSTWKGGSGALTTTVYNTIMAGNSPVDCWSDSRGTLNGGYNLIMTTGSDTASCSSIIVSTSNPVLGAVTGNPAYFPLNAGSPAINAGMDSPQCPATDQRGVIRPQGAHCDIGSYEVDLTAPTVTNFAAIGLSNTLDIPIATLTATDNVGVTGYLITDTSTAPLAGDTGWAASAPTTYHVAGNGDYTLYPWAKDATGNVSGVYGTTGSVTVDITLPTVTAFAATSPINNLNIPITTFTGTDNAGVTGYIITISSTAPLFSDPGWSAVAPTSYHVAGGGMYTLYPWAKDAVGNVSAVYGSPVSVKVNTTTPILSSPINSSLVPTLRPTFRWLAVPGATKYQIEVSRYASLASPLVNITVTALSYTPTVNLPANIRLYWSARVVKSGGTTGPWTIPYYSFTIKLSAPTLVSPANNAIHIVRKPTFKWNAVSGATTYTIQVSTSSTFSTMVINVTLSGRTYTPTITLLGNKVYYWRVMATGPVGTSAWSSVFHFTTTP